VTVAHFRNVVEDVAPVALEDVQVRPHFPVNLSPRDSVGFSHERHEFLEVPRSVHDVLSSDLTVEVNVRLCLAAVQHFPLAHGEQFVAICALV